MPSPSQRTRNAARRMEGGDPFAEVFPSGGYSFQDSVAKALGQSWATFGPYLGHGDIGRQIRGICSDERCEIRAR